MNKTFITEIDKQFVTNFYNKGTDIIRNVTDLRHDAIDEIVNLFECFDIQTIDVENYDENFELNLVDIDQGRISTITVKKVELYEGTIYVYDDDDETHTSEEWFNEAPELLQELSSCIEMKFRDIEKLAVGKKVRWIDPAIEDYDEDDRQEQLDRIFTIYECPEVIERDSIIGISDGTSEADVLPMELVVLPD